MRTNLILNFLVFLGFLVQAQNPIDFSIPKTKIYHKRYINYTSNTFGFKNYGETWFSLTDNLDEIGEIESLGSDEDGVDLVVLSLFPDSTIIAGFDRLTGFPYHAFTHGIGEYINPSLTPSEWSDQWADIVVDSIEIPYAYRRNTSDTIVDTLFVDYLKHFSNDYLVYYDFNGNQEMEIGEFPHIRLFRGVPKENKLHEIFIARTDTVLLEHEDGDSTENLSIRSALLDVNDSVAAGERYGIYLRFQPGYDWTPITDTLSKYNEFFALIREQEDNKSPKQLWARDAGFCTYTMNTDVLEHTITSNTDLGYLIPGVLQWDPWVIEHLFVYYKLTSNSLSLDHYTHKLNEFTISPNPATNVLDLNFTLDRETSLNISLIDGSGRVVYASSYGILNKGAHKCQLNIPTIQSGLYFLKINNRSKPLIIK